MNKLKKALLILGSFTLFSGMFSSYAFSLYSKKPSDKSLTIGLGLPDPSEVYANVYNGDTLVSSNLLEVNPDNNNELRILNLSVQKGYKVKAFKAPNKYFGTNYEHNISVGISTDTGLVSSTDDYIAVQTGTYDFYYKFTDTTYETCNGVYVNVDNVRTLYLQDYWNTTGSPYIHYWGSDVITSDAGENYVRGEYVGVEGGKNMYRVLIPSNARYFNLKKYDGGAYSGTVDTTTIGSNNAVWYNDGGIGTYSWNP